MGLRRLPRAKVIVAVVAAVALVAAGVVLAVTLTRPAPPIIRDVRIPVVDGPRGNQRVVLDASFFTPAGGGRVPAVLLAHGFGETKDAVRLEAENLARAGFAVLTWSARGFGASTGQIGLNSPDYEVKDVEQLVSWLARQPRVLLDHPGDPRVGITGASYGGGISLLAAAYDHRIDAVVAQSTWNNLATALFPNGAGGGPANGVFKRQWAGLLFTQGSVGFGLAGQGQAGGQQAQGGRSGSGSQSGAGGGRSAGSGQSGGGSQPGGGGRPGQVVPSARPGKSALCGRFQPRICAIYQQVAATGRPTPQAISLLLRSSPASVADRMRAPTLLIQGEHDSLFGLGQASANYQAIRRNGAPVDMVWFAGGHDGGDQETTRVDALTAQWLGRWLAPGHPGRSAGTGQPGFAVTRVLGFDPSTDQASLGIAAADSYPGLGGTRRAVVRLAGPPQQVVNPAGGTPASISVFPGLGSLGAAGLTFDMPGQSAAFTSAPLPSALQVTGSPTVRIRVAGIGAATLFAKVYDVDQAGNATLPNQLVAPLRVSETKAGQVVTVALPTIDYNFAAGHRLRLVLTTTDFAYATSSAPVVYRVALAGPGAVMPEDPALTVVTDGLPWWVWAAPAAALVAAPLILGLGRRRGDGDEVPELADVPLEITRLTKRYGDGQLAADDLSLRVERGQILGLLGPNGAGKTTTLRALMGLLHPDTGTITIFGRRVHAGSAALSRLGSFVEGPGFLPHLSGRDNLSLYWRATGRPADGAHLAEVLEVAGLGAAIDRRVRSYSRGMRQRLAIAQAMLGLPDLLVLDEPMNGLDPPQIREMRDVLLRYAADGRTVILSSHLLGEVEQTCTHVVVMNEGRRLAAGPVGEIIGESGALMVGTPEPDRAVAVMRATAGIDGAEAHPDGVLVHHDGVPASAVVAALVEAGIPVERVGPSRRLEDAFLALIAAPLDGSPDAAASPGTPPAGPDLVTVRGTRDDRRR
jgi:ABC-2 type transport system ATP-binding protein